jgi:molecular chaperone GrpE
MDRLQKLRQIMTKNKGDKKIEKIVSENQIENNEVDIQQEVTENEIIEKQETNSEELIAKEKDKFLRLFAEFENYKRRTVKERLELYKTANKELMSALLPVVDDFERAINEIKKAENDELFKGVELIQTKFRNTLEQKGLTLMLVKSGDLFDADIHQAITQIPAPTPELKGKIIDVIEQGYTLGDNIIRFPKVIVGN